MRPTHAHSPHHRRLLSPTRPTALATAQIAHGPCVSRWTCGSPVNRRAMRIHTARASLRSSSARSHLHLCRLLIRGPRIPRLWIPLFSADVPTTYAPWRSHCTARSPPPPACSRRAAPAVVQRAVRIHIPMPQRTVERRERCACACIGRRGRRERAKGWMARRTELVRTKGRRRRARATEREGGREGRGVGRDGREARTRAGTTLAREGTAAAGLGYSGGKGERGSAGGREQWAACEHGGVGR